MKKIYTLITAALAIASTASAQQLPGGSFDGTWETSYTTAAAATEYNGYLNIEMMGQQLASNKEATVEIANNGDGTCTFTLPDFVLSMGGQTLPVGDIVVENVTMAEADGTTTYTGSVEDLNLMGGIITADVTLNGTIDAAGTVDFAINVVWNSIPINVTFTSNPVSDTTEYNGYLNIEMMGQQLASNKEATVEIANNGDGTCTFTLPDFVLAVGDQVLPVGDIVVENVTMAEADGITTYSANVEGLSLMEGAIIADVNLIGTFDANIDKANFGITVNWQGITIIVTFTTDPISTSTEYTGYLNVEMGGQQLVTNEAATVSITDNGNGTCTFILPNFSFQGIPLGDIVVENVTMTEAAGTTTYEGSATGMVLVPGSITADVALTGTIDANGTVDFKIDVTWVEANLPINVTFTSDPTSSVANIDANGTAIYGTTGAIAINGYTGTASIYGITGQLLKSVPVDGNALINIDGGIYIVHIDGTTAKVLVK